MSPFFTAGPDGSELVVSKHFWIFWAVTLPLTLFVIVCWTVWTLRSNLRPLVNALVAVSTQRHHRKQKKMDPEGTSMLSSAPAKPSINPAPTEPLVESGVPHWDDEIGQPLCHKPWLFDSDQRKPASSFQPANSRRATMMMTLM